MNIDKYRKFLESYNHSTSEKGDAELVDNKNIDLAMKTLEEIGVEPLSVLPYREGVDLFWGSIQDGHLLIHVCEGEISYSGLNKPGKADIWGSGDLTEVKMWLVG